MIGRNGERGSRISALAAWHDDDDDDIYRILTRYLGSYLHTITCAFIVSAVGNGHGDQS